MGGFIFKCNGLEIARYIIRNIINVTTWIVSNWGELNNLTGRGEAAQIQTREPAMRTESEGGEEEEEDEEEQETVLSLKVSRWLCFRKIWGKKMMHSREAERWTAPGWLLHLLKMS